MWELQTIEIACENKLDKVESHALMISREIQDSACSFSYGISISIQKLHCSLCVLSAPL